jgi:hypothetical protein
MMYSNIHTPSHRVHARLKWLQKDVLNEHGSALGFPTPEPIFIIRAESQVRCDEHSAFIILLNRFQNLSNLIEVSRIHSRLGSS